MYCSVCTNVVNIKHSAHEMHHGEVGSNSRLPIDLTEHQIHGSDDSYSVSKQMSPGDMVHAGKMGKSWRSDLASVWALTSITDDENTHLSLRSFDGTVRLPGWDGISFGVQKEMVNKGFHVLLHGRSWWRRDLVVLNLDWASWHLVQTLVDDSQRLSEFFHSA